MPGGDQAQAPPIVHAIGGALGTALAVLLFYPLERARIELQAQAQRRSVDVSSDVVVNDELESVHANVNVTLNESTEDPPSPTAAALDSSWESAEMDIDPQEEEEEDTVGDDESSAATPEDGATPSVSWSMRSSSSSDESATGTVPSTATKPKRLGLIDCLIKLHAKQALYQGLAPVVTTIATSQFVFFYLNAMAKKVLVAPARQKGKPTAVLSLVTSCFAGIVNVLLTNPLWVVNMAIVTGNTTTSNLWKELKSMAKEKGLEHLWNFGFLAPRLQSRHSILLLRAIQTSSTGKKQPNKDWSSIHRGSDCPVSDRSLFGGRAEQRRRNHFDISVAIDANSIAIGQSSLLSRHVGLLEKTR
jgi:hypothetical protein